MGPAVSAEKGASRLRPVLDRTSWRTRSVLAVLCLGLMAQYLVWRVGSTLPPLELEAVSLFSWGYLAIELIGSAMLAVALLVIARRTDRSTEATDGNGWLASLPHAPLVDILVPTYNEDLAVLEPTIVGTLGLDYPCFRLWVLDDGRRPWLREYCEARGVRYLSRDDNRNAKAGNLNHGLAAIARDEEQPSYVAVFDADFVPTPQFLQRTVPLFKDPSVGLVQTPQHFYSDGPIQLNLRASGAWPEEQRVPFDFVLPSRDAWDACYCCGTSQVLRYDALTQIGGFPLESVTEDYLTTLKLRCIALRTVYLNERLSHGLAPAGVAEFVGQRARWCLGTMQIVRSRWGPFSRGRLPFVTRLHLIDHFAGWALSPVIRLINLTLPIAFWFSGVFPLQAGLGEAAARYLPFSVAVGVTLAWLSAGRLLPVLNDVAHTLVAFDLVRAAGAGLARPRGHRFRVTLKRAVHDRTVVHWRLVWLFAVVIALHLAGIAFALSTDLGATVGEGPWLLALGWTAFNVLVASLAALASIDRPRPRQDERFSASEESRILWEGKWHPATVLDASLSGLRVAVAAPLAIGSAITVNVSQVGVLRGRVARQAGEGVFALSLEVEGTLRDALIRKLFSGRYGPTPETVGLRTTLRSLGAWLASLRPAFA